MWALRGIDLQLERGKCLGIFGPNGAGKTTLLKILATLTRPSAGTVWIAGYNVAQDAERVRPLLGVLSHRTFLYSHLTAVENLHFYGRMFGVERLSERILEVLQAVELETQSRQLVRTYSRGMQQRLAIARTILHQPMVLLLDEPYTGLDHQATRRFQEFLRQFCTEERTVIMSTHDWQRGLELCDEIVILRRGQIVYQSHTAALPAHTFEQLYYDYVG
jgi:heme exporter protein A